MARDFWINGAAMITVKGRSNSAIGTLQQLALPADPIHVVYEPHYKDINVDAWGAGEVPIDEQWMLASATVTMNVIDVDPTVLAACWLEANAGGDLTNQGSFAAAGTRMGNRTARFSPTNHYIGLNIAAPINGLPHRFLFSRLTAQNDLPLGVEKSIIQLVWRVIPYAIDAWGGDGLGGAFNGTVAGTGAQGYILWDYTPDT